MMTTTIEPRVLVADLVFHWRDGLGGPFCRAIVIGHLTPHTQAIDQGATECPDCDRHLRLSGWRNKAGGVTAGAPGGGSSAAMIEAVPNIAADPTGGVASLVHRRGGRFEAGGGRR